MIPRRTARVFKPRTIWEQKGAPSAAEDLKVTKRLLVLRRKLRSNLLQLDHSPKKLVWIKDHLPDLPDYTPPLDLHYQPSKSFVTGLSELQIFQQLLIVATVEKIVVATNNYV